MGTKIRRYLIVLVVLITIAGAGLYAIARGRAQQDFTGQLRERLEALHLPVNAITVNTQQPLDITIQLQSDSRDNTLLADDIEHLQLAETEISALYLAGKHPERYNMEILNNRGETIFGVQNRLPADDSQPFEPLAAEVAAFQLELKSLPAIRLEQLVVTPIGGSADSGQQIDVQVRALDNSENNTSLNKVVGAFYALLPGLENRTNSLARGSLKILNLQGQQAFSLVLEQKSTGRRESMRGGADTGLGWLFGNFVQGGPQPTEPPFDQEQVDQQYTELVARELPYNTLPGLVIEHLQVQTVEEQGRSIQRLELRARVFDVPEKGEVTRSLYDQFRAFVFIRAHESLLPALEHGQLQIFNKDGKIVLEVLIDVDQYEETIRGDVKELPWLEAVLYPTPTPPIVTLPPEAYPSPRAYPYPGP